VLASAMNYVGYRRYLGPHLQAPEPQRRQEAMMRWLKFYAVYETVVIVAVVAWLAAHKFGHVPGLSWLAPPVGLLVGSALPLQAMLGPLTRAGRG
jgi:hypothetical protein